MGNNSEDNISISVPIKGCQDDSLSYGYYFRMGMPDPEVEAKLSLPKKGSIASELRKFTAIPSDLESIDTKEDTNYNSKFGSLLYSVDNINFVAPQVEIHSDKTIIASNKKIDYSWFDKGKKFASSVEYKDNLGKFEWSLKLNSKISASINASLSVGLDFSSKYAASISISNSVSMDWGASSKYNISVGAFAVSKETFAERGYKNYTAWTTASNDKWFLKTGKHARELVEQKSILSEQLINLKVCSFEDNSILDNLTLAAFSQLFFIINSLTNISIVVSGVVIPIEAAPNKNNLNAPWIAAARYILSAQACTMLIMGILNLIIQHKRETKQESYIAPSSEAITAFREVLNYNENEATGMSISKRFIKINALKTIIGFSETFLHLMFDKHFFHMSKDGISMRAGDNVISVGENGILISGKNIKIESTDETLVASKKNISVIGDGKVDISSRSICMGSPEISMSSDVKRSPNLSEKVSFESILKKYPPEKVPERIQEVEEQETEAGTGKITDQIEVISNILGGFL